MPNVASLCTTWDLPGPVTMTRHPDASKVASTNGASKPQSSCRCIQMRAMITHSLAFLECRTPSPCHSHPSRMLAGGARCSFPTATFSRRQPQRPYPKCNLTRKEIIKLNTSQRTRCNQIHRLHATVICGLRGPGTEDRRTAAARQNA